MYTYKRNFTLIHGTWAQKATWTQEGSNFSEFIKQNFETDQISIGSFGWSGINNHFSRLKAGITLSELLKRRILENPNEEQILIGHSHGGNIALHTLKYMPEEYIKKIKIITLSTPFLNLKHRKISHLFTGFSFAMAMAISFPVSMIFFFSSFAIIGHLWSSLTVDIVIYLSWFIESLVMFFLCFFITKKLYLVLGLWDEKIENEIKDLTLENTNKCKIYSAILSFDEAFYGLQFNQITLFTNLIEKIFLNIQQLLFFIMSNYFFSRIAIIIMTLFCFYVPFSGLRDKAAVTGIGYFVLLITNSWIIISCILFLLYFTSALSLLFNFITTIFFRSNHVLYGWETLRMSLLCSVTTTKRLPFSNSQFFKEYNKSDLLLKRRIGLRHSSLYESKKVVNDFSEWIKKI